MDYDVKAANDASRDAWNTNAVYWDERMGEGNDWHLELVWPATSRLLALEQGERVLDVGCGNGLAARRMAAAGMEVVAIDVAEAMLERARARPGPGTGRIEYRVVDASDEGALLTLGEGTFDAAVANMVLMDMADIRPLFGALSRLLGPGGRFVFSVSHPAFNGNGTSMEVKEVEVDGELRRTPVIRVGRYLTEEMWYGDAIAGQPVKQPYFDRPLQSLLGAAFEAGFVVDGLEEPAFAPGRPFSGDRPTWDDYPLVPPVLVVRVRPGRR